MVASDVGDMEEIVVDGETGFLTKPGDAEEIAFHVTRILKDVGLGKKLGEEGRAHVKQNFNYDAVVEKVITEYEKCLK